MAVGHGVLQKDGSVRPIDMAPGDRVLFGAMAGTEIELDGDSFLFLRDADIIAEVSE